MIKIAVLFGIVALATAEFCGSDGDCFMERCPSGYTVSCADSVCTCDVSVAATTQHPGECSTSDDCHHTHGKCENNDKHWYCNENRCCCGEPCSHAVDHYACRQPQDCEQQFYHCTNNDKHWYCTEGHCHCGSRH